VRRHLGELRQRRPVAVGQRLAGGQQFLHLAGRGAGAGEVEALGRRQFQQAQQVARLVGHPVVQRLVRRAVAQHVRRRTVSANCRVARSVRAVGLELDGPAAQGLDALQDAQGLWAEVFHGRIIGGASRRPCIARGRSQNGGTSKRLCRRSVNMVKPRPMKLQFEEAHPDDWDAFNAWTAGPVP
jgi:hypothetical protein